MKNLRAEFSAGKIIVTTFCDDLVKHVIISEFTPDGKFLSARTEYLYGIPAPVKDSRLMPLCFFEALKAGAYAEASSYLSPALRQNIPAGGEELFFKGFFGDFISANPAGGSASALVSKKENGYETKLFIAEIENGFIVNFKDM